MEKLVLNAYAKINPFLEITAKRSDGYHEIDSVMMSVSICDTVTLTRAEEGITITADVPSVPTDSRNIAYKVAARLIEAVGDTRGVHIDIKKRIPSEAGMGGGSADGAAVLVGLNKMLGEPLTVDELCALGASVGADIPFCIRGGCIRVGGIGEKVVEVLPVPPMHILVAKMREGISTPAAYATLDALYGGFSEYSPKLPTELLRTIKNKEKISGFYNIFEQALDTLAPSTKILKGRLSELSRGALLCGSGTAIFAVFDNEQDAIKAKLSLQRDTSLSFVEVCKAMPNGVEIIN